jgi:hypothetical protein
MASTRFSSDIRSGGPIALGIIGGALGATAGALWSRTRHYRRVEAKAISAGTYVKERAQTAGKTVRERARDVAEDLKSRARKVDVGELKDRLCAEAEELKERAEIAGAAAEDKSAELADRARGRPVRNGRVLRGVMIALDAIAVGTTVASIVRAARGKRGFRNLGPIR